MEEVGKHSADQLALKEELDAHRAAIDELDAQLLELLNKRATHSLTIREIKAQLGLGLYDSAREAHIVEALQAQSAGPLYGEHIAEIYSALLQVMRGL